MKIRRGDTVKMLSGKDRGRTGEVISIDIRQGRVVVEGLNMVKKHVKKKSERDEGGIITVPRAVPIAKVQLVCPKCSKPTRVKFERKKGKKLRVCPKCKSEIDISASEKK